MSQPSTSQFTERAARVIHSALFVGVFVIFAAFAAATRLATVPEGMPIMLRYVGLAQLLMIGIVIYQIRARIPTLVEGADLDGWWAVNGQRVIMLWVLAEGTATLGGVIWFLTADSLMLLVLGAALVLLFRLRPSVWTS